MFYLSLARQKNVELVVCFDLNNISISSGAACSSGKVKTSHVLKAMGFSDAECSQTIRISINKKITESQIKELVETLKAEIK